MARRHMVVQVVVKARANQIKVSRLAIQKEFTMGKNHMDEQVETILVENKSHTLYTYYSLQRGDVIPMCSIWYKSMQNHNSEIKHRRSQGREEHLGVRTPPHWPKLFGYF